MNQKVRVIVEVKGGIVQNVFAGDFVEVLLVDFDNIEDGGDPFPEPSAPDAWCSYADELWEQGQKARAGASIDCPKDDPDCLGADGECHDACERPAA